MFIEVTVKGESRLVNVNSIESIIPYTNVIPANEAHLDHPRTRIYSVGDGGWSLDVEETYEKIIAKIRSVCINLNLG